MSVKDQKGLEEYRKRGHIHKSGARPKFRLEYAIAKAKPISQTKASDPIHIRSDAGDCVDWHLFIAPGISGESYLLVARD